MAKKGMTLKEIKDAKTKLDLAILDLVKEFEADTKVRVSWINFEHKNDQVNHMGMPEEEERGPIVDVETEIQLDV